MASSSLGDLPHGLAAASVEVLRGPGLSNLPVAPASGAHHYHFMATAVGPDNARLLNEDNNIVPIVQMACEKNMWKTPPQDVTKHVVGSRFSGVNVHYKFEGMTYELDVKNMIATCMHTGNKSSVCLAWVRPQDMNAKFTDEQPGETKPRSTKRRLG